MTLAEFENEVTSIEHVTRSAVRVGETEVSVITEAYLSNADGTRVERGRGHVVMTLDMFHEIRPGKWLLAPFERAIADTYDGYTRYATSEEIAQHKEKPAQ